jgi:hypothetical protein
MKEKNLKAQIKEMEIKKREETAPVTQPDAEVSFDSWFHQRAKQIPKVHMKEILMADFKARGLGDKATMAAYDKALGLYGIKLK